MISFAFLGVPEIAIIVVVVVLLLFGGRIPQLARNLGRSFVEFKAGLKSGEKDEIGDGEGSDDDRTSGS